MAEKTLMDANIPAAQPIARQNAMLSRFAQGNRSVNRNAGLGKSLPVGQTDEQLPAHSSASSQSSTETAGASGANTLGNAASARLTSMRNRAS